MQVKVKIYLIWKYPTRMKKSRLGIGERLGRISDGARMFGSRCVRCNHPQTSHEKVQYRDEGRMTITSVRVSSSECRDCKKVGKKCSGFESKK